jgi:hypothetical protein
MLNTKEQLLVELRAENVKRAREIESKRRHLQDSLSKYRRMFGSNWKPVREEVWERVQEMMAYRPLGGDKRGWVLPVEQVE